MELYYISSFVSSMSFFLVLMLFPATLLYFLAQKPNKIVSGIFSVKVWFAILIMFLAPIAFVMDEVLDLIGLNDFDSYGMNLEVIRNSLIVFTLALLLHKGYKKYFPKTVLNNDGGNKSPGLYVSQIFHAQTIFTFAVLCLFIVGFVSNYLLQFILNEHGATAGFVETFTTFVAVAVPTLLLGVVVYPAIFKGKRFLVESKSDAYNIFASIMVLFSLTVFIALAGFVTMELLEFALGTSLAISKEAMRGYIIGLTLSGGVFALFVHHSGGKQVFLK